MTKLELKIEERIHLIGLFNQVKGDIETLESVLADVKEVSLSTDEKVDIGFKNVMGPNPQNPEGPEIVVSYAWDKTPTKEITLSEKTIIFIMKFLDEKNNNKELTMADSSLLAIYNKLKNR